MSDDARPDNSYEPPTREFIRNSLVYGLVSESEVESKRLYTQNIGDSYSDLGTILKKKNKVERILIQYAFANKRRIKSIPVLGKLALLVKRNLVKRSISKNVPNFSRLDLSRIMHLEVNDFIWELYVTALGRAPDDEGWSKYKYLLCSGASREAIAYIICTSIEFANRAQVAFLDQYRKAFWRFRLFNVIRRTPVIGWIWAIAAIPNRIFRLEVEERIRHADSQLINRQRFEALSANLQTQQVLINGVYSKTDIALGEVNLLISKFELLQTQVETLCAEIKTGLEDLSQFVATKTQLEVLDSEIKIGFEDISQFKARFDTLSSQNFDVISHIIELTNLAASFNTNVANQAEIIGALQIANQNIIHANVKLDETGILISETTRRNKPVIHGSSGGVTAVQTKEYIIGVPSEEWRLAVFLSIYGFFEMGAEKYFRSILKEGMNVIDVGAYLGIYTLHALSAGCCVYSYEPTPGIFDLLVDNIGINGFEPTHRANPFNFAVTDREGEVEFSIIGNGVGQRNSIFASNSEDKTTNIRTISLDHHLSYLDHVDIVKIDAEGAEPLVLRGMRQIITKNPSIKIIMEFTSVHIRRGGKDPRDFIADIRTLGLVIHSIHEETGELSEISDEDLCTIYSANILLMKPD